MAETLATIITAVRDVLLNITTTEIADAVIDEQIRLALGRLQRECPHSVSIKFAGNGTRYYTCSTVLTGWLSGFSDIHGIIAPAPVIADDDDFTYLDSAEWTTYNDGTSEYIRLESAVNSDQYIVVEYSIPWILNNLDGATSTTLSIVATEALKYLAAAYVCYSLSAQASGYKESQMPGDFINYRSSQSEYKRSGDTFLGLYGNTISPDKEFLEPAIVRASYKTSLQSGGSRLTHTSNPL